MAEHWGPPMWVCLICRKGDCNLCVCPIVCDCTLPWHKSQVGDRKLGLKTLPSFYQTRVSSLPSVGYCSSCKAKRNTERVREMFDYHQAYESASKMASHVLATAWKSLNSNDVSKGLNTGQISAEDAKYAEIRAAYLPTALDPPF